MKKVKLLVAASLLALGAVAKSNKPLIMVGPDVLVEYQVVAMSSNGKWACGNVNDGSYRGFVWDLENNDLYMTSAIGSFSALLDIADDGTAVGLYETTEATANGASVEVTGYFKDRKWHMFPGSSVTEKSSSGMVNGISDNGRYAAGIDNVNGTYTCVVWDIQENTRTLFGEGYVGCAYDVTNDGQMAAGWSYHPVKKNRTPTFWTSTTDSLLLNYTDIGPYSVARSFSPDGTKIIANRHVYDIATKEMTYLEYNCYSDEWFKVTNAGNAVGWITDWDYNYHGVYYHEGKIKILQTYLEEEWGVDFEGWSILQCTGISEDEMTFAVNAYDLDSVPHPMIISLNANTVNPAPTQVKAAQLEGTQVCKITWKTPRANAEGVKGYNVWRNGEKITAEPVEGLTYYDKEVADGTYTYTMTAVYADSESDHSGAADVTVSKREPSVPRDLTAFQTGIRDLRLMWYAPLSDMPALKYGEETDFVAGMGGGTYNMEVAVRFEAADLAFYGDAQITDVSFYPMSRQTSWTANFYEVGNMTPFYTETLSTENIVYGIENTFRLQNPVTVPEGKDILVGIAANVTNYGGYNIFGVIFNKYKAGYTDLIRREGEETFASLYETAMSSEDGAYEYPVTFPVGICLGNAAEQADHSLTGYKIYADGAEAGTAETEQYRVNNVPDGAHTYGVAAVYGNGTVSATQTLDWTMTANDAAYKAIGIADINLDIDEQTKKVAFTWTAPVEDDETVISYANDTSIGGLATTESQNFYQVAAKYDNYKLRGYDGYQITHVRFYPLADADFTFFIRKDSDSEPIAELALERGEDYTIGMWNTIALEEPITVEAGSEYMLIVDCWDVVPGEAPIAMDSQMAYLYKSDLYSDDDGETFQSLSYLYDNDSNGTASNINSNWMIGFVVRSADVKPLPILGYNVKIDNKEVSSNQTETTYTHEFSSYGYHKAQINVNYETKGEVKGTTKIFAINDPAGIDAAEAAPVVVQLDEAAAVVTFNAEGVTRIVAYDTAGAQVAAAEGNRLEVSHLHEGIYLLQATINGKEVKAKICVKR